MLIDDESMNLSWNWNHYFVMYSTY